MSISLIHPVPSARATDPFGPRGAVAGLPAGMHRGQDYAAPLGTPIRAAHSGRISQKYWELGGHGHAVAIDGPNYRTRYAHMRNATKYKVGDFVSVGDIIGYVGATGAATGPHVCFELIVNGRWVNPVPYINRTVATGGMNIMAADVFVRRTNQTSVWALDLMTGRARRLSKLEWTVYQRGLRKSGEKPRITNEGPAAMRALVGYSQ